MRYRLADALADLAGDLALVAMAVGTMAAVYRIGLDHGRAMLAAAPDPSGLEARRDASPGPAAEPVLA